MGADGVHGAHLAAIRWYQGRLPELASTLTELAGAPTRSPVDHFLTAALAVAAAQGGDSMTAASTLAALEGRDLGDLPRSSSWLACLYGVIEAAHLIGDARTSARAYDLLRPFAELPMMASTAISCFGSAHHALGVAALTIGDLDLAVAHLSDGLCRNLALGHWPAVLVSRLRYAEALERRNEPGDLPVAAELRSRAARLWDQLAGSFGATGDLGVAAKSGVVTRPGMVKCSRQGVKWLLQLSSKTTLVADSIGMLHLAVLIANPGAEIAAIDLVAGSDALSKAARSGAMPAQQVLDRTAMSQYRERLKHLSEQEAGPGSERDWLVKELTAGSAFGGRPRTFTDGAERARIAVGRSIRRALAVIESADPVIGEHLRSAIHTGARCWYRPA